MVMFEELRSGREGTPSPEERTGKEGKCFDAAWHWKGLLTSLLWCHGILTLWCFPLSPGCAEGYARDATEIQNIQIADGDICRSLSVPLYMVFPRLFTCPTLETTNFKVGKQSLPGLRGPQRGCTLHTQACSSHSPQHLAFGYSTVLQ